MNSLYMKLPVSIFNCNLVSGIYALPVTEVSHLVLQSLVDRIDVLEKDVQTLRTEQTKLTSSNHSPRSNHPKKPTKVLKSSIFIFPTTSRRLLIPQWLL